MGIEKARGTNWGGCHALCHINGFWGASWAEEGEGFLSAHL
jgi:hypothetical protein